MFVNVLLQASITSPLKENPSAPKSKFERNFKVATLSIIVAVFTLFTGCSDAHSSASNDNTVSPKEAELVASIKAEESSAESGGIWPDWKNPTIGKHRAYYSLDNTICAYEFNVLSNGKEVGFIVISGRRDWSPVIQAGGCTRENTESGECTQDKHWDELIQTAIRYGYTYEGEKIEPIIYFVDPFSMGLQIGDQMKKERTVIDFYPPHQVITLPDKPIQREYDKEKAQKDWQELHDKNWFRYLQMGIS